MSKRMMKIRKTIAYSVGTALACLVFMITLQSGYALNYFFGNDMLLLKLVIYIPEVCFMLYVLRTIISGIKYYLNSSN